MKRVDVYRFDLLTRPTTVVFSSIFISFLLNVLSVVHTSNIKVEEFVSRSSSLPIRENIWSATLKEAYSAGTNEPT